MFSFFLFLIEIEPLFFPNSDMYFMLFDFVEINLLETSEDKLEFKSSKCFTSSDSDELASSVLIKKVEIKSKKQIAFLKE